MIYFCIPVHNEEKTAGVVLWKIRQVMAEFPRDYQILLADDASDDGTMQVLDPYRRVLPLILMRCHRRRGYAASLEMLLREAARRSRYPRRDIVVVMQADFSEDAEHVPAMLRRMESGADLVVGGPVRSAVPPGFLERTAGGFARRLLFRRAWPEPVTDPLNGFSAFRLACIRRALEENGEGRLLRWEGRAANAALLAAAAPHARRIDAVELVLHPERRQRPPRGRPLAALREVRRFARNRPSPGLLPPDSLVPDEVHGDLSALRQQEPRPGATAGPEPQAARRPRAAQRPKRAGREQPGERTRKDGKPRRPRREAGGKPADEAAAHGTRETAAEKPSAPGRKRRRGARTGERPQRTARGKAGSASKETEAAVPAAGAEASVAEAAPPAQESAGAEGAPKKRRRRGRRGRGGRRPAGAPGEATAPGDGGDAGDSGPDAGPGETDGA